MIIFNRLNGETVAINPDLIERVEETPDTVITLVDDKKFLVAESLDEVISLITDYRAYVIARSTDLYVVDEGRPTLHVVPNETIVSRRPDEKANDQMEDDFDVPAGVIDYLTDLETS
jgi:flagellar protein FlbD